jgi:hypothetical protein
VSMHEYLLAGWGCPIGMLIIFLSWLSEDIIEAS